MEKLPHVRLVVSSARTETLRYLRDAFPDEQTLALPSPYLCKNWLERLQVRHLMLLEGGRELPPKILATTMNSGIKVSSVNIGHPTAITPLLLDHARNKRQQVRLCVINESFAQKFSELGVPAGNVVPTGCLYLDSIQSAPVETLKHLIHLPVNVPVIAAVEVPPGEEWHVLDSFMGVRTRSPQVRLLLGPRNSDQIEGLNRKVNSRGWTVQTRVRPNSNPRTNWDVLILDSTVELLDFLPLAQAAYLGGTLTQGSSGGLAATVLSAGVPTIVGPHHQFKDLPLQFLEHHPHLRMTSGDALEEALLAEVAHPSRIVPEALDLTNAKDAIFQAIESLLPENSDLPPIAQDWRIPTWRDRFGQSHTWRKITPLLTRDRIDSLENLNNRLGNPKSIMCLGNGPSSEDIQLASLHHDCLMRVNWRWQMRQILVNPRVVFVGDAKTLHKVKGTIFGVWNDSLESGMLLRYLLTHGLKPMNYFNTEQILPIIRDLNWPARPTNGALMIAVAAALQPAQLIIAGVDLYQHPEGRYPGDLQSDNSYARSHTRRTDLNIIQRALNDYRGDLLIISPTLKEALSLPDDRTRV